MIKDIASAIKRIDSLKENMAAIVELYGLASAPNQPAEVTIFFEVDHGRRFYLRISMAQMKELLENTDSSNKKEIERLQPVIDMANAALKGVLAGGDQ